MGFQQLKETEEKDTPVKAMVEPEALNKCSRHAPLWREGAPLKFHAEAELGVCKEMCQSR